MCKVQFNGDLHESLQQKNLASQTLNVVHLEDNSYEVVVNSTTLHEFEEEYTVDISYDPVKPKQGLVYVYGIIQARRMTEAFKDRHTRCGPKVKAFYEEYCYYHNL
jgi:hypothetical protein